MNRTHKAGFSLIEIIIVIGIIAALVAAVTVTIRTQLAKSKRKRTEITLKSTEQAVDLFHSDLTAYPTSLEDLVEKPTDEKLAKKWGEPYLAKIPVDGWGNELVYQLNPKGTKPPYELYSWGPNGEGSPKEEQISAWEL
ncbi:MAG: type II secretion system major pseudopilin GspG [Candidatus Babeliaceae bacterium]